MHVELFSYQKMIVFTIISLISCNHRERQDFIYLSSLWVDGNLYVLSAYKPLAAPCDSLLGKPFWISDRQQHKLENTRTKGKCCFNHIIKLPQKDGMLRPIY